MTGTWPLNWSTGDVVLAAEFKKGLGAIFDTTLGGTATAVDITSISASYAHLLVVAYARSDVAATSTGLALRFNNDVAANYDFQQLLGTAATPSAAEAFAQTQMTTGSMPGATAGANLFNASITFIPHYAGSTNNKLALSISATKIGTTTGSVTAYLFGGFWRSSAAINRVTLLPVVGSNFVAGTRVTLYGMGA